ncbi:MAG: urea carboxylase-associated family protein [Pricia sp.]
MPPKSGTSFELKKGQYLKVICPEGEQVADLVAYNALDTREFLSNGKTLDYEQTVELTKHNTLWSNMSHPMLNIVEDTCGINDFLLSPCCKMTMKIFYDIEGEVPTCHDNLYQALQKYGIEKWSIPTAFNIFMNVPIDANGDFDVCPPTAVAGDYIVFLAKMDMVIGLTACSAGSSNNFSFKPIAYSISEK